jgi:Putative Ig domain
MTLQKLKTTRHVFRSASLVWLLGVLLTAGISPIAGVNPFASESAGAAAPASTCISDAILISDPTYNHAFSLACTSTTAAHYKAYAFNLTGCASGSVTISTCGSSGCSFVPGGSGGIRDSVIAVYRAPGGSTNPFNPGQPCNNLVALNDDTPGCGGSGLLSTVNVTLSSGHFVAVVSGFDTLSDSLGSYNLFVDAGAGCTLTQEAGCPEITVTSTPGPVPSGQVNTPFTSTTFSATGGTAPYTFTHSGTLPAGMTFDDPTATLSGTPTQAGVFQVTATVTDANGCPGGLSFDLVITNPSLPCITDQLVSTQTFFRPNTIAIGSGVSSPCTLSGVNSDPPHPVAYRAYELNLSGCSTAILTATLCDSPSCPPITGSGALRESVIYLYRTGGLTAGTGASGAFDPNNPCDNLVAANEEQGQASSGGLSACSANSSLSGLQRTIGPGQFTIVVAGFDDSAFSRGAYDLSVTAPGCSLSECAAITATVSGGGTICAGGSSTVTVTLSGGAPPYTVSLDNGGGTQTGSSPLNFSVSPSATTTYSVSSATDSAGCPATASGSATVTVNQPPTTASTGGPKEICSGGTTAGLGGNTPTVGTGSWSVVSGGTGAFNPNASTPNATFTHTGGAGPIVVRWTISNPPCPDSTANVTITIDQPPTTANAGPDQSVCGSSATLAANTPSVGTGTWTVVSGTGTFANSHSPTTTVTGMTPGANVFRWTITSGACPASADDVTITSGSATTLSALGSANVWVGLKNSDDVGTKFDLLAEVLKNGVVIGSGQINDVPGGSSGFNNAILDTINLTLSSAQNFCSGDTLSFRLSVRVAASSGHVSGTARLWYNDAAANSRFNATVNGTPTDYFLRDFFLLDTTTGPGKRTSDVLVNRNIGGNPFKPFGTWNKTF